MAWMHMAYDLVVGKSNLVRDNPTIVGGIEFDEFTAIYSIGKKVDCLFLNQLTPFEDRSFSIKELQQANEVLFSLLPLDLNNNEREMLHKLISVVSFAINKNEELHGVAD